MGESWRRDEPWCRVSMFVVIRERLWKVKAKDMGGREGGRQAASTGLGTMGRRDACVRAEGG